MITFVAALLTIPLCAAFGLAIRLLFGIFGFFAIVREGTVKVYVLFGKVLGILEEPGLHSPLLRFGPAALVVNIFGKCTTVDTRLDQEYLRSQPVNSEEGAPMGVGIWYEMAIHDPVAYLFKNSDPRGSLRANVANASVRCLSNMPLGSLLGDRHGMSEAVRIEVSAKSEEWGYRSGTVYVRKVHFRDGEMMRQIEGKVVNRLRQVTSSIQQDGTNQVNIIRTTAERTAAVEFAKAAAMRPQIVGEALKQVGKDEEIARALFDILELQRLHESGCELTLVPGNFDVATQMMAAASPTSRGAQGR